jgi:hypothetical protein
MSQGKWYASGSNPRMYKPTFQWKFSSISEAILFPGRFGNMHTSQALWLRFMVKGEVSANSRKPALVRTASVQD